MAKRPENLANVVKMQVNLDSKQKKGRGYSPQLKSLAISIYHASGKAYRMLSKLFHFGSYTASWKDIENLYEKDKSLPVRADPKLTEKHIHCNNFCKMKVKLVTQVFSHTVAASICTYVNVGALPSSAMGTAELLLQFDSFFVCVNSSSLHLEKKFKCALNHKSQHMNFLKGLKALDPDGKEVTTGLSS